MNGRQFSSNLRNAIIVAISLSVSTFAMAVGLGPIKVDSYIGQPLDATIKVNGLSPAAAERTTVQLASINDYQSRGIAKLPSHDNLRFRLTKSGNGYLIDVTSTGGVREPFINFLLTINSDGGSITREYAVFLNPDPAQVAGITSNPAPNATQIQPASSKTQGWGGNVDGAKSASLTGTPELQNVAAGATTYGPVKPGETLYSIAAKFRPSESVSVNSVMRAIYRNNRDAFATRNMDSLMAGYTLTIPDLGASSSRTSSAPVTTPKPKQKSTQPVKSTTSNETDDAIVPPESSQSSGTAATAAIANANSNNESILENPLEEDNLNEEQAIGEQEPVDKMTDEMETDHQESHAIDGLVADLSSGMESEDGLSDSDNMALPEEQIELMEDENTRLDSQLTLDTPDSLGMVGETQRMPEDEFFNETLMAEEPSEEVVQEIEPFDTEAMTDEYAVSEESSIETVTTRNASTDNSPTAEVDTDTNQTQSESVKEPFLPMWMMAAIGGLIVLLGLLAALFIRKKKSSSGTDNMSEDEIAEMLAALEEDESLKESLNFTQLTENPSEEESFDDVSDQFDFDALANEAEMLGKSDDEDMLYMDEITSKQDNKQSEIEELDLDFDFDDGDEPTSSIEDSHIEFTPSVTAQSSEKTDDGFDNLFSLDTDESSSSAMTTHTHEAPVSTVEETDSDDEMFDFDFDDDEEKPISNMSNTSDNDSDMEFDFDDESPSGNLSETTDNSSEMAFDFSIDEDKEEIKLTIGTASNDTKDNNTSSAGKPDIDPVELSETMEINLDLANSFIVTGSVDKAKEWLSEVMTYGNEDQKARAQQMLNKIK